MRCSIALALTVSLAAASDRAAAEGLVTNPIARAIRHEGARLAAHATDASESTLNQYGTSVVSDWSRVRSLRRGTALLVTVGNERRRRRFVRADDVQLIVR